MENPNTTSSSPKTSWISEARSCGTKQEPLRLLQSSGSGEQLKEKAFDKSKANQKRLSKEQTKPIEIKLHTQERAVQRAGFNYLVANKLNLLEEQRKQEANLQKMIEEEEIQMMRKEMIPRAQLMPLFDRPFFPQRSTRPLTIPKEPSFHILSTKSWRCISCCDIYTFHHQLPHQPGKPIR